MVADYIYLFSPKRSQIKNKCDLLKAFSTDDNNKQKVA
jgi:hypothetical protein